MKVQLSGDRIREIRTSLGLSVPQFSAVMAIHPGTMHRWESAKDALVSVDGVAAGLMAALDRQVPDGHSESQFQAADVGKQVLEGLIVGGALFALALLIREVLGKSR